MHCSNRGGNHGWPGHIGGIKIAFSTLWRISFLNTLPTMQKGERGMGTLLPSFEPLHLLLDRLGLRIG